MTNSELLNYLYKNLTVLKDVNYKTEFYLDDDRSIIYTHKTNQFAIKYKDDPIPQVENTISIHKYVQASINSDMPGVDGKTYSITLTDMWYKPKDSIAEILRDLFREIEHGDQEHRSWLKNKIEDFIKQRGYES